MIIFRKLLFCVVCVQVFTFKLDLIKNHDYFSTIEAMLQVFKHCNKHYKTIIIVDTTNKIDSSFLRSLHNQFHSVILQKKRYRYSRKFVNAHRVDAFLITTSAPGKLETILNNLHKAIWWDHTIPIYILNFPNRNCTIALKTLQKLSDHKVLTAYFLCHENNDVHIFTYNPFTSRAHIQWIEVLRSPEETQWTLYRRKYHPETVCQGLHFDRTKYFDGHQMTVVIPVITEKNNSFEGKFINYTDLHHYKRITLNRQHLIVEAVTRTLNVTVRPYLVEGVTVDGIYRTFSKTFIQNISPHLILSGQDLQSTKMPKNNLLTLSYPLAWVSVRIATNNRGYQTLVEKLWDFYGIGVILFTTFVLLITFVVIWLTESKNTSFAIFEIIRLLINHGLYARMNTLSLRIFFITILIYFLIIQATFSGNLAKFLTKPELRRHPETREDLTELGYTSIYDSTNVKKLLAKNVREKLSLKSMVKTCLDHILYNDSSAACIFDYSLLLAYSSQNEKLYTSTKLYQVRYSRYQIRNHWSLSKRVNWLLVFLDDLGFRQLHSDDRMINNFVNKSINTEVRSNEDFHPIKLEHLTFSFLMLAVGLASAILSFCVEIFIRHKLKWNLVYHMQNIKKKTGKIMNKT